MSEVGKVSKEYLTKQVPYDEYKSVFGDNDGDSIPNVDDVSPMDRTDNRQIEEVRLSDEMKEIIDYRNDFEEVREEVVQKLENIIDVCGGKGECGILSRTKTPYSIINKLRRRSLTDVKSLAKLDKEAERKLREGDLSGIDLYKGLTDVVGTMVVTPDKENSDKIKNAILDGEVGEVLEFEDMYAEDKFGYRAYHFLVAYEKDGEIFPVEIQVKTKRVKALSDMSHEVYKKGRLNAQGFKKLTDLAVKSDTGNVKAQREFDNIIGNKNKLMGMITTNVPQMMFGGIYEVDDKVDVSEKNTDVEKWIPQHILNYTFKNIEDRRKYQTDNFRSKIEEIPNWYNVYVDDKKMAKAYLKYDNGAGATFFVLGTEGSEGVYGFMVLGKDEEGEGFKDSPLNMLTEDYGDNLINWELDYSWQPQPLNAGFKAIQRNDLMSQDVELLGADVEKLDLELIMNQSYPTTEAKNRKISQVVDFLGDDIDSYEVEVQNFVNTYQCGLFQSILSSRHYKTIAGLVYLDALENNRDIADIMIYNSCKGQICNYFDKDIQITCIENETIARRLSNMFVTNTPTWQCISQDELLANPPSTRKDSVIIFADAMADVVTAMDYLLPNGVCVAMVRVSDFTEYFRKPSEIEEFNLYYTLNKNYRISADVLILHITKK
jgi:ppGpp synthetase/RelA/SpoT-type nucleotidyltranferase